jgi:hypothetical protein
MNLNIPSETDNKTRLQAEQIVMTSLLESFRPLETLVSGAGLAGMIALALTSVITLRLLALGVVVAGGTALYVALRIRIDAKLFKQWNRLVPVELDRVLQRINPKFKSGRSLEARLAGAYALFKAGILLTIIQYVLLVILAWNYA